MIYEISRKSSLSSNYRVSSLYEKEISIANALWAPAQGMFVNDPTWKRSSKMDYHLLYNK